MERFRFECYLITCWLNKISRKKVNPSFYAVIVRNYCLGLISYETFRRQILASGRFFPSNWDLIKEDFLPGVLMSWARELNQRSFGVQAVSTFYERIIIEFRLFSRNKSLPKKYITDRLLEMNIVSETVLN